MKNQRRLLLLCATVSLTMSLVMPASAGTRAFVFVSFSQAATINPGAPNEVVPRVGMQGSGTFDAVAGGVEGGGTFVLFNNSSQQSIPKPIIFTGTWVVTNLVSYTNTNPAGVPFGSYDHIQAAILVLTIELDLDDGTVINGATLTLVCNIGAAGAQTGLTEGYQLTIPGTPYGLFTPVTVPNAGGGATPLGITHLSTVQQGQNSQN